MSDSGKYAVYLRKSRADMEAESHGEGETLLRHEKLCMAVADKRGLNVSDIYREVVSGESISARPEVKKLLRAVERGEYSGVIVMEIERLARGDTADQGIIARAFSLSHTRIITPIKDYDPDNEFDEEYFEFGLFMSRREYKVINRRIQRGRILSAKEGKYIASTAPYGYKRVKIRNGKGYTLEPEPEEAEAVKKIFKLYNSGIGVTAIAKELDSEGVRTRRGKNWSRSSVKGILSNPVYTGRICWSRRKEEKRAENGEIVKKRVKNNDYISAEGLHKAIIDNETFKIAGDIMNGAKKPKVKKDLSLKNPLQGLVYCGLCNAVMVRSACGRGKDSLVCSGKCGNISAPAERVETVIIDALEKWLKGFSVVTEPDGYLKQKRKSADNLRRELNSLYSRISKAYELLEKEIYDEGTFKERIEKLSAEKERIRAFLDSAEKEISGLGGCKAREITVTDFYRSLNSAEQKNLILKALISEVKYYKYAKNKKGEGDTINFDLEITPRIPPYSESSDNTLSSSLK